MAAPKKTCQIEIATHEDGFWDLRASVTVDESAYSTTHRIEGDASWTEAELSLEVLKLY